MDNIELLKNLIHAKYKTQKEFCSIAEIKQSTLSTMFERGINGTSFETVKKICFALSLSLDKLANVNIDSFYISDIEKEILLKLRQLSVFDVERIMGMIELKLEEKKLNHTNGFFKSQKK